MNDARSLSLHLASLLRREHEGMVEFLLALSAFDARRCWVELGYTSLFYFLHRGLGLSKGAAFYRAQAAELVRSHPEILEPLREGRLCITSLAELAKVITPANQDEIIPRFFHASSREAKDIVAAIRPAEVVPKRGLVTRIDTRGLVREQVGAELEPSAASVQALEPTVPESPLQAVFVSSPPVAPVQEPMRLPAEPQAPGVAPEATMEPLTADLRRLHVTVSRRFLEKLAEARDALSHAEAGGSTEAVLERALDALLAGYAKRRKALVVRPRTGPRPPSRTQPPAQSPQQGKSDEDGREELSNPQTCQPRSSRHVSAAVERAVWIRDLGRCQWPVSGDGRCDSSRFLQLDHVLPVARGGPSTLENLRLLCGFHNRLAAREVFGEAWMDRRIAEGRSG